VGGAKEPAGGTGVDCCCLTVESRVGTAPADPLRLEASRPIRRRGPENMRLEK
jgi:hypothetical protein